MNVKTAQLLPAHKDYGGQRQTHGEEPVPRVKRRDPGTLEGKAKCKEVPLRCQLLYLPRTEGGKKPTSTFPLCEKEHRKENAETDGPGPPGGRGMGGGVGGDQVGAMGTPTLCVASVKSCHLEPLACPLITINTTSTPARRGGINLK